jgi:hypothetical protein
MAARWIRMVLVVGIAVTARSAGADDECNNESWLRSLTQVAHDLGRQATLAAAQCAFDGANDKQLAEFAKRSKRALGDVFAKLDKHARCKKDAFTGQKYAEGIADQMGRRIGLMFAHCSSDARALVKDLAAKGTTSEADIRTALQPLEQKYFRTAFPEL